MRLWSLHPRYLDHRGLVALWREALLAQAVLCGRTRGYTRHPQLRRFQEHVAPRAAVAAYLQKVQAEAAERGYSFDASRIEAAEGEAARIAVPRGQVRYEWEHLMAKLRIRDSARQVRLAPLTRPQTHPLFRVMSGGIADWERP